MTDEKPQTFPPLPTVQLIPKALIEQWVELPVTQEVDIPLTRGDFDNLYFSINNLIASQTAMQDCLVKYSQGDIHGADKDMDTARRHSVESLNGLRSLYASLMASALRPKTK